MILASTKDFRSAAQRRIPRFLFDYIDGGAYVTQTNGSGKSEIYLLLPKYQFTASGVYQLPYRINVAGSVVAREGFGQPFFSTVESADPVLPEKRVLLGSSLSAYGAVDLAVEYPAVFGLCAALAPPAQTTTVATVVNRLIMNRPSS